MTQTTQMSNLLFTTKGRNKYRIMFIIMGVVAIVCSFIIGVVMAPSSYVGDELKMMNSIIMVGFIAYGIVAFVFAFVRCSGYINVYDDHAEGKGLIGKGMNTFYLSNYQIKSATQESYYLCLHTDIGCYKIICDKESRNQIMRIYTNMGARSM